MVFEVERSKEHDQKRRLSIEPDGAMVLTGPGYSEIGSLKSKASRGVHLELDPVSVTELLLTVPRTGVEYVPELEKMKVVPTKALNKKKFFRVRLRAQSNEERDVLALVLWKKCGLDRGRLLDDEDEDDEDDDRELE